MSSVLAWSSTAPKEKLETDDPELLDEDSETEENAEPVEDGVEKKVFVKFAENDFPLRCLHFIIGMLIHNTSI